MEDTFLQIEANTVCFRVSLHRLQNDADLLALKNAAGQRISHLYHHIVVNRETNPYPRDVELGAYNAYKQMMSEAYLFFRGRKRYRELNEEISAELQRIIDAEEKKVMTFVSGIRSDELKQLFHMLRGRASFDAMRSVADGANDNPDEDVEERDANLVANISELLKQFREFLKKKVEP